MEKKVSATNSSAKFSNGSVGSNIVIQSVTIGKFTAAKQSSLFKSLKQGQFSGQLIFKDDQKVNYTFFLYLGRVIYATGGVHPVRRWQRHLRLYCPNFSIDLESLQHDWPTIAENYPAISWEYALLDHWLKQEKITREQFLRIVKAHITDILFDLSEAVEVSYDLDSHTVNLDPAIFLDVEMSIVEAWKQSQAWTSAKLTQYSPNLVPKLKESFDSLNMLSEDVYKLLLNTFKKKKTIRDIATQSGQNLISLTQSLAFYAQRNVLHLEKIDDLPPPINLAPSKPAFLVDSGHSIGCFSENLNNIKILNQIVTQAGYKFLSVTNELEAIAVFLEMTPSLIFLEIKDSILSSQLRKLKPLQNVPLIMLTEEHGISTVLKAKIGGFWGILNTPIQSQNVFSLLNKHLILEQSS